MVRSTKMAAFFLVTLLYVLHQDLWFWQETRPLVFGFLPPGLFYHVVYTMLISLAVWWLVHTHWPAHLESKIDEHK
jgi:hypothetical protein